ncbi:hypothetical protein JOD54_004292 [Actinokineospora baliensis]|nr:hypothetical protein [Actinokineospora baliensis]
MSRTADHPAADDRHLEVPAHRLAEFCAEPYRGAVDEVRVCWRGACRAGPGVVQLVVRRVGIGSHRVVALHQGTSSRTAWVRCAAGDRPEVCRGSAGRGREVSDRWPGARHREADRRARVVRPVRCARVRGRRGIPVGRLWASHGSDDRRGQRVRSGVDDRRCRALLSGRQGRSGRHRARPEVGHRRGKAARGLGGVVGLPGVYRVAVGRLGVPVRRARVGDCFRGRVCRWSAGGMLVAPVEGPQAAVWWRRRCGGRHRRLAGVDVSGSAAARRRE